MERLVILDRVFFYFRGEGFLFPFLLSFPLFEEVRMKGRTVTSSFLSFFIALEEGWKVSPSLPCRDPFSFPFLPPHLFFGR